MSKLFKEDKFSNSFPKFNKFKEKPLEITEILKTNYEFLNEKGNIFFESIEELGINSLNFKIFCKNGEKFALKKCRQNINYDVIFKQLDLVNKTSNFLNIFPKIYFNNDNKFLTFGKNKETYIVSEFIEGRYFSGEIFEIELVFEKIKKLFDSINKQKTKSLPLAGTFISIEEIIDNFKLFFKYESEWINYFDEEILENIKENISIMNKLINLIEEKECYEYKKISKVHIDLHPHNILITDNSRVCFLDNDSILSGNHIDSISFAILKLGRQVLVKNSNINFSLVKKCLSYFYENVEIDKIEQFKMAAYKEVLRRISLIFLINISKKDKRWNNILPIHLNALHEIPIIFSY